MQLATTIIVHRDDAEHDVHVHGEVIEVDDALETRDVTTVPGEGWDWCELQPKERKQAEDALCDAFCETTLRGELLVALRGLVSSVERLEGRLQDLKYRPTQALIEELKYYRRTGDCP